MGGNIFVFGVWGTVVFLKRDHSLSARTVIMAAIVGFVALSIVAFVTHPTRSQDIYWSLLLGKGFSYYGVNPYQTPAGLFSGDAWAYPVLTWKDMPMIYGPIWMLFIAGITMFAHSLDSALVLTRMGYLFLLVVAGFMFWKILAQIGLTDRMRANLLLLLAWNPFLIQAGFVDLHNDILVMVAILASYYFLLNKKYDLSIITLLLGSLVKYSPLLLIVVPLFCWIKEEYHKPLKLFVKLSVVFLILVGIVVISYAPFGGLTLSNFIGLSDQVDRIGLATEYLSGTAVVLKLFALSFKELRLLGIVLAMLIMAWSVWKKQTLKAYTIPFLAIFFFATPWFQPWYLLWIFPLILISWPNIWFVILTASALLMPELLSPSVVSLMVLIGSVIFLFWRSVFVSVHE